MESNTNLAWEPGEQTPIRIPAEKEQIDNGNETTLEGDDGLPDEKDIEEGSLEDDDLEEVNDESYTIDDENKKEDADIREEFGAENIDLNNDETHL